MKHQQTLTRMARLALLLTAATSTSAVRAEIKSIELQTVNDAWAAAQPRYWDIGDNPFEAFIDQTQPFSYENYAESGVRLTYDTAPNVPYFVGHIEAWGLKPNFAYQIKLMGKPEKGPAGWGASGGDASNKAIGSIGRWFCNSSAHPGSTNFNDDHYATYYEKATDSAKHDISGYLFSGVFVTDAFGNANVNFTGQNNYHITFQSWQLSGQNLSNYQLAGTVSVSGGLINSIPPLYYGYGTQAPSEAVTLYYQWEDRNSGQTVARPRQVVLPNGTYRCRLVLTEETFHNNPDGGNNGGRWLTVLGTEEVGDTDLNNDVVFTIAAPTPPAAPANLTARATSRTSVQLSWGDTANETGYRIERSANNKSWGQIGTANQDITTYNDSGLKANTTYYYRVRAANAVGVSPYSSVVSVKTPR